MGKGGGWYEEICFPGQVVKERKKNKEQRKKNSLGFFARFPDYSEQKEENGKEDSL